MKRYLIPTITILLVLAVSWAAFGQLEERGRGRGNIRQRLQNMSEEEREQFTARMRQRRGLARGGLMNPEAQEQAIKTIEEQLAKLKATQITPPEEGFRDLPEEERAQLREKMSKAFQSRREALQTIIAQVARLQGRGQPEREGGRFVLINTSDLKSLQEAAEKEKAKETSELLQRLIAGGGGRSFRSRGAEQAGQRPERDRGGRGQRPEGGRGRARQGNR
jgi:hypothetical protein